jgi:uroporphyrin-3 C-methyltransferase
MSEANSPVVVEAAQPPSPPPASEQPPRERDHGVAGLHLAIALVSLILAVGLAVATYFIWHQVQQLVVEQASVEAGVSERIQPLRTSLDGLNLALANERQSYEARVSKLDEDLQGVSHRISVVASLFGRSERGWTLAEIEYLLRIANQRLQLQRDVKTAAQALKAADERLRELADPHYISVREQIARDLDAVKAVPAVDVDGLSVRLSAALASLDELPVAGAHYKPALRSEGSDASNRPTAQNIDELGSLVWTSLSELFRLREHDQPVAPMLPPEREYFLRENLRLQLAAARLALLRDDQVQYRSALNTATKWLDAYFDKADSGVQQLAGQLAELAAVNISPALPDASRSLALLRRQIQLSEQQQVQPVVPAKAPQGDVGSEAAGEAQSGHGASQ